MKRRLFHAKQSGSALAQLSDELGISLAEALRLVRTGAVYVEGRRVTDETREVGEGARMAVVLEEGGVSVNANTPPAAPLRILYEDERMWAIDKPAGMTSQPTEGRVGASVLDVLSAQVGRGAGLVHRLDKDTSGVMVFGKTKAGTSALAAAFREGQAHKEYVAVTQSGIAAQGVIDTPLSKDPSRPGRWRALLHANGLSALTHFTRLSDDGRVARVALFPQTGRTHQLRAHLRSIGFPIVGDALYGGLPGPRCLLHARRLSVVGVTIEAPIPDDFEHEG